MLKIILNTWLLAFLCLSTQAQHTLPTTNIFGKVPLSEFSTTIRGSDSSAAAVKIFDVGTGYFEINGGTGNFVYVLERHVRYHVIHKTAYELADQQIVLYQNNGLHEKLEKLEANTYNLVNGKIQTSTLAKDARFSEVMDKNHLVSKFTLPNVKEGSIIEFKYKTTSEFLYTLDSWYFQGSYPTLYSSFTISIPEFYAYKVNYTGYVPIESSAVTTKSRSFYIPSTLTSKAGDVTIPVRSINYQARNVPAIETESYITTLNDYISKIGFELQHTNFPGSGYKEYTTTWEKITQELMLHEKFGKYINRRNYPKNSIDMPADDMAPELRLSSIFNQLKNKIKWDGKYGTYTTEASPKSVFEKKSGNSADINLLLLNLLTAAGFQGSPILVSTRQNGKHPGYPMMAPFNSVLLSVQLNGKEILLDATDRNNAPGMISNQYLNHMGLKFDQFLQTSGWMEIEPEINSKSTSFYNLKLTKDLLMTGNLYFHNSGYKGQERRKKYQDAGSEDTYLKTIKSTHPGLEIGDYELSNLNQAELPLEEQMAVNMEDAVEVAGQLIYFNPILLNNFEENPFRLENRKFPVDFAYPSDNSYRLALVFPEELKLETLPKNEAFKLPDNAGRFSITFVQEGNKILVTSKLTIAKALFSADEYYDLRELFKNVLRKQAEQIVFKK